MTHVQHTTGGAGGGLAATVKSSLVAAGVGELVAVKVAALCGEIDRFLRDNPELVEVAEALEESYGLYSGGKQAAAGARYLGNARRLGLGAGRAAHGFRSYSASGGAAVLQVFVERFQAYAKSQGLELNDCAMAVSKLSLSIVAAGTGSVTALSGVGAVFALAAAFSTFDSAREAVAACGA